MSNQSGVLHKQGKASQTKAQLVSIHKEHETRKHAGNCASAFPLHGLLPLRITLSLSLETFVRNFGELSDSVASLLAWW